jgi:hypothetical protein
VANPRPVRPCDARAREVAQSWGSVSLNRSDVQHLLDQRLNLMTQNADMRFRRSIGSEGVRK